MHVELATDGEKLFSSHAVLKIIRDSKLQISIQPFAGIEVARIEFTPDSVRMLDRMNKRYVADTFAPLGSNVQPALNFYNLQALFTNRIFLPGETGWPGDAFRRFRCEPDAQGYVFSTQDADGLNFLFTTCGERLCATEIADRTRLVLHLDYGAFTSAGEEQRPFPTEISAEWRVDNEVKASLALRYSNIELDRPVELRFDIPKNCERLELSQILKLMTGQP